MVITSLTVQPEILGRSTSCRETPPDGTKSFKIMSMDIHTVEHHQIKQVYHIEDWSTALQQLK